MPFALEEFEQTHAKSLKYETSLKMRFKPASPDQKFIFFGKKMKSSLHDYSYPARPWDRMERASMKEIIE